MTSYGIVGGCVAPTELIPVLNILQRETGCVFNSIYRGDDALDLLHRLGKHSQREIYNASPAQRAAWGILGNPNPPGRSTHELHSDGVPYSGPIGRPLNWWQCGIDVDNNHVTAVINRASRHGWSLFRPYPSGNEFHHVNFRSQPRSTMSLKGTDHSTGGARIGGTLRAQGFHGIVRYAAEGRSDVNISRAEADDLKANGIPIGVVCEHSAQFLLGGFAVGVQRARGAESVARAAGLGSGVMYFAADWDCTNGGPTFPGSPGDQNMHEILNTLSGAASVIGRDNVGFYGSYFAIDWLVHNAPWIKWYWCTEAWSKGLVHPRANLYQRATSTNVAGVDCDIDVILTANWGQRTGKPVPPKPPVDPLAIFPTSVGDPKMPNHGNERLTVEQTIGALQHPGKYRNYLKGMMRSEIKAYRDRCYDYAKGTNGKPKKGWGYHDLGTRWQRHNDLMKRIDAIK